MDRPSVNEAMLARAAKLRDRHRADRPSREAAAAPGGDVYRHLLKQAQTIASRDTTENTATITTHAQWVRSVAFSPDGNTPATGSGEFAARANELAEGAAVHPGDPSGRYLYQRAFEDLDIHAANLAPVTGTVMSAQRAPYRSWKPFFRDGVRHR